MRTEQTISKGRKQSGVKTVNLRDSIGVETYMFLRNYVKVDSKDEKLYQEHTNEDMVKLYREGIIPFDLVLHRFIPLLSRKARQWVPGYQPEELFQELVIKLHRCCTMWEDTGETKFITYLYTSLDNLIAYIIRTEYNDKHKANSSDTMSYEVLLEWGFDKESTDTLDRDIVEIIEGLNLSPRERLCVEMIMEGRQNIEIAAKLEITKTRVGQIIRRLAPKFSFLLVQR